jgi:hypothetical protein
MNKSQIELQMPGAVTSAPVAENRMLPAGMGSLNVLIGFEESQASCIAFRQFGHKAFSCDIEDCSGGKPEWHLKMDIFEAIKLKNWDIIILHAPCTYTALCGNRWYWNSPLRAEGIKLCKDSWEAACAVCDYVVLEQPKTIMQKYIGKKTQVIHPWMFGHKEYKETWLWIKGLPPLIETSNVLRWMIADDRKEYEKVFRMPPGSDRQKLRSKTYPGIAAAFAMQWGGNACSQRVCIAAVGIFRDMSFSP